ncbi:related to LIM domain and RING finger protein YDR266C [Zygosaccharomyces bailii ISA1307]|nr:related to LIM domain and RING finger protein YDR266C [Zygosaccharomyces bailii ISA1307]
MSGDGNKSLKGEYRRVQTSTTGAGGTRSKKNFNKKGKGGTWNKEGHAKHHGDDDEFNEKEFCLICADKLQYAALSPCSHRTCHKCSFRQRALYDKKTCLVCRSEIEKVIFTEQLDAKYDDIDNHFAETNEQYGIDFTSRQVASDTLGLLKFKCALCIRENQKDADRDYGSFNKYKEHLKDEHNKTICMICAMFKHAFPSELKIYTPNQLRNHQSRGDGEGFKGHPMCAFCSGRRFYSDDELYLHMRDQHEKCHICDRIDPTQPQYFKNYEQLFQHFKSSHYVCTVQSCLDDKFVVFRDEIELQAHILGEHGDIIRGKPKLFQSELSTFISAPSRVIREDGMTSNMNSSRRVTTNSDDSPEVKKLRLEERAKHYLNGSTTEMDSFLKLNKEFDKGNLSAEALLNSYNSLFTSPNADVYLLVRNLAETYPANSNKYRSLEAIYVRHEQQLNRNVTLPSLSNDSNLAPTFNSVWSANNNHISSSHGRNVNPLNLPSLKSPPPSHDIFASPYKAASYKNLNAKSNRSSPAPTPVVRTASPQANANSKPSYLNKKPSKARFSTALSSQNKNKLAALDLPSLPTPKPKVYIPPVNRPNIPDPKQWGKSQSPQPPSQDPFEELLSGSNTGSPSSQSSSKKKDKRKQLLFHIGI